MATTAIIGTTPRGTGWLTRIRSIGSLHALRSAAAEDGALDAVTAAGRERAELARLTGTYRDGCAPPSDSMSDVIRTARYTF